jgi:lipopolysaccharide transport system ATP-binding protein
MSTVIRLENVGKKYQLRHQQAARYKTLREAIGGTIWKRFGNRLAERKGQKRISQEDFLALQDISFEIEQGERLGIIGRNGAGKSTLLKLLSRITAPSQGRILLKGRVGSLLEVGTGFHPELTGRENIFLNGAILGMSRQEIKKKFDEIVEFAEVERFLDTPVKRYSSGMYVRLAFAVAAHLEPEILLVDEVLAVGDAKFQKKCINKLQENSDQGKTVLFVSHNMGALESLCQRAIWLDKGILVKNGPVTEVISAYLQTLQEIKSCKVDLSNHENRLPGMFQIIKSASIYNKKNEFVDTFMQGETLLLQIEYDSSQFQDQISLLGAGFILRSLSGVRVGGFNTYMASFPTHSMPVKGSVVFTLNEPILTPGEYSLTISFGSHQNHLIDKVESAIGFTVLPKDIYKTGYLLQAEDGVVAIQCQVAVIPDP